MIRLFGQREVLKRTAAHRETFNSLVSRPTLFHVTLIPEHRAGSSLSLFHLSTVSKHPRLHYSVRYPYSTNSSPPTTTEKHTSGDPAILPAPKARKVDLHPAPRGSVSQTTAGTTIPSSPLESTPSLEGTSSSTPTVPTPSSPVESATADAQPEGVIQQVKSDWRAGQHVGIIVPPPANAGRFAKLFHQARELFKFYWNGLKAQWQHQLMVREIQKRVKEEQAGGNNQGMTRWETQFVRVHQSDLRKLVPFVMILIVIEEILPLIVIYAPFMLPSTCILPSQRERIYKKQEERKVQALTAARWYWQATQQVAAESEGAQILSVGEVGVEGLDKDLAWTVCRAFTLSDRGPRSMVNRRLRKHLAYLGLDDALITREGGSGSLTVGELRTALGERGYVTVPLDDNQLRRTLDHWLEHSGDEDGEKEKIGLFLRNALETDVSDLKI